MPPMQPYTVNETPKSKSLLGYGTDIITAPFKPSTHAWLYMHNPSMWSGTQGLYVPWDMRAGRQAVTNIKSAFRDKKYVAGFGQILKSPLSILKPFGGGTRVLNFAESATQAGRLREGLEDLSIRKMRLHADIVRKGRILRGYKEATNMSWKQSVTRFYLFSDLKGAEKATAKYSTQKKFAKKLIGKDRQRIKILEGEEQRILKKLGRYEMLSGARTLGKWGLRAGKGVAAIGMVQTMWEIAKLVGEPIGQAAVNNLNTALTTFNDRFDPEMGGRLALSYLSHGAATERQRALSAMSKAGINGRSAFGQEAKYQHS